MRKKIPIKKLFDCLKKHQIIKPSCSDPTIHQVADGFALEIEYPVISLQESIADNMITIIYDDYDDDFTYITLENQIQVNYRVYNEFNL